MAALQTEPAVPSQGPLDTSVVALQAGDVLANTLLEEGLLGHELEAEPVLDHCEASADEARDAGQAATDILAGAAWHKGQAAVSRHPLAHAIDLLSLKRRHGVDRDADVAIQMQAGSTSEFIEIDVLAPPTTPLALEPGLTNTWQWLVPHDWHAVPVH